jgi:uncharacterized Zn-finger protein
MMCVAGYRPFKCPDCPAAFASSSTLKQHARRHTGMNKNE